MTAQTLTLVHNDSSHTDHTSSSLTPTIPTALIADSALLRMGLQHILRDTPFTIAEAASVTGPKRLYYCAHDTALVIIEVSQNTGRVLEVIRQVRERSPETRIVALADQFDLGFVQTAHEAGVTGFCLTASGPDVLIKSLELVMLGESVLPFEVLRSLMDAPPQKQDTPLQDSRAEPTLPDLNTCKLSAREAQVLSYLREGTPNKIIARQFDVTEATVKVHVKSILRKIGVANRTQAAMWASQHLPQKVGASVND
jgi:two-component system, NarL family, nitrate/nitrite response regulator NarL